MKKETDDQGIVSMNAVEISEEVPPVEEPQQAPAPRRRRNTFERRYYERKRALEMAVSDPDLSAFAGQYGFTAERLNGAIVQADALWGLAENQMSKRETQLEATRRFNEAWSACREITRDIIDAAKLAFRYDRAVYNALKLGGARPNAFSEWVAANTYLYSQLLGDPVLQEALANYNTPLEKIQLGRQQLQDAIAADRVKEDGIAEAQRATERKIKANKEFAGFVTKFFKVMRIALEDEPQLLEKLGITMPSAV